MRGKGVSRYRPYPSYKDSGVEWLGAVPNQWEIKPLFSLYRKKKRAGFSDEELLSVYRDYGVIKKSSRDDNNNRPSEDLSNYQLVEPSDLVTNKMKAWQGSIAVSGLRGIVSPAYFIYIAERLLSDCGSEPLLWAAVRYSKKKGQGEVLAGQSKCWRGLIPGSVVFIRKAGNLRGHDKNHNPLILFYWRR